MMLQRQLQELQHNGRGSRFANLLSMASPLPSVDDREQEAGSEQMGSPMSGRQHSRCSTSSLSSQPSGDPPARQASIGMAAWPKIQPQFRPIKTPSKRQAAEGAAHAPSPTADQQPAEGLEDMVQILLRQVCRPRWCLALLPMCCHVMLPMLRLLRLLRLSFSYVRRQVAQLQAEKQQVLLRCSALELENANLQVRCLSFHLRAVAL